MKNNIDIYTQNIKKNKYPLRIYLWLDLCKQIADKPIFGHGFDSYRAIYPSYQSPIIRNERMKLLVNAHRKYIPLFGHGHNDWLQKISEFGFLGVILIFPYLAKLILTL